MALDLFKNLADKKSSILLQRTCKSYGYKRMSDKLLKEYNTRDFFILGSGSTINDLTKEQWEAIRLGFSLGLNKWLLHDFIPNAMSLEKNTYNQLKTKLLNDERLINSALKFVFYAAGDIRKFKGFPHDVPKHIHDKIVLRESANNRFIKSLEDLNHFHQSEDYLNIVKRSLSNGLNLEQKGSIYRVIQFAIGSGFKNIILCGVDLNNTKYFWDDIDFHTRRGVDKVEVVEQKNNTIHQTDIASEHSIPISSVLESLSKGLSKHGITLSVASNKSKLAEFLPIWNG